MSSLDSQFLCLGTMFSTDIVSHYARRDRFTDRQHVLMTRAFIIAIVAITYACSLAQPKSVFTLGIWCFSGFASLFPLVFAAVYWRRLTKWGAYAGVLAAISAWIYFFKQAQWGANRSYTLDVAGYEVMPVAAIFLASLVAMVGVSLVTRPPKAETLQKFFATVHGTE